MSGMFRVGATAMPFLGFSLRALDNAKPFLSETGFRSFLGVSVAPALGMTMEGFVLRVIENYVDTELRGELIQIRPL